MQIYLARNGVQAGPYTLDELNLMLRNGEVVLDDLMWHAGMDQWQKVGEVTNSQYHYQPINAPVIQTQQAEQIQDNPSNATSDTPKRVSVAELYGRKEQTVAQDTNQSVTHTQTQAQSHTQNNAARQSEQVVYASVSMRFLAVVINVVLFVLTMLPFMQAFLALNPDPKKMQAGNVDALMAYSQELASKIPPEVAGLTSILLLGYVLVQSLLILVRGQSFGKLLVGIRTVDANTLQKPSFVKRVLLRVVVLFVIYQIAFGLNLLVNVGLVLLGVNYFMAANNPKKQGWHDKLAGTVVIKNPKKPS